ncbi:PEP/pyruvate-binding domain-containing protein [Joostella sp.]|uniref:PEP/pyruvate-binding domain-containing protein n=1 Tax=Joostella sp. TaxID=2231138 RepID=UPI003A8EC680
MRYFLLIALIIVYVIPSFSQEVNSFDVDNNQIREYIQKYKKDIRGPYRDLRWFCDDGTFNMPKEPCGDDVGGVQRARYKEEVIALSETSHVYLGQILSTTNFDKFWDQENYHSRMKQYQLEKYLKSIDDGWINRRAQYYRGALQVEDEEAWGKDFFIWLLKDEEVLEKHFYMVRQAIKDIPHAGDDNVAQLMRSQSKVIAEEYEPFMDLRIKIHGQPQRTDIAKVEAFKKDNDTKLTPSLKKEFNELIKTMNKYFAPVKISALSSYLETVTNAEIKTTVTNFIEANENGTAEENIEGASDLMWYIRNEITNEDSAIGRLALMDLSLKLENIIIKKLDDYSNENLDSLIDKICYLSTAAAASGYTEIWEWEQIAGSIQKTQNDSLTLQELDDFLVAARKQLEWGTSINKAVYDDVVGVYQNFEPLVHGFLDDKIRGSVALPLGNAIGKLGTFISNESSLNNRVFSLSNQSHIHGINPGYAFGKLVVVDGNAEGLDVDAKNIYVFERPPSDLKPVAGLLTVSEGNLVSHLQLLARNLGIPNAAISNDNFLALKEHNGENIFYAVSNKGTVIIKPEAEMTPEEHKLFSAGAVRNVDMVTVPLDKINLEQTSILNLRDVNSASSGIYCGPKAANLGQLKQNFPDEVVEGFVIPFGIFFEHMKQTIPGGEVSYWEYLTSVFAKADKMKENGASSDEIEKFELAELAKLRALILEMPLLPAFVEDLEDSFSNILNGEIGEVPVFLRSDTNMEDLKNFTGAGLNLTLFNVAPKDEIIQGIKTVWASPYTERSFKWRQKILNNPENVYPSIVAIPGVNNDYSGVMITKGVTSNRNDEITVAFSRGVGGAVDGQAAEAWSIRNNGTYKLISPAREPSYKALSKTGGTVTKLSTFEKPILNRKNMSQLQDFSKELIQTMTAKGMEGPYDVELGFENDKLWLFQVRPYVENKNAKSSTYLESITPKVDTSKSIPLNIKL